MYYEEEVINGILCHRSVPGGEWVPFTLEALSIAYRAMKNQYEQQKERADMLETRNIIAMSALHGYKISTTWLE